MDKEERKRQAAKHESLMKGVFERETAQCVEGAVIYEDGEGRSLEIPEPASEGTETRVVSGFLADALYRDAEGRALIVDPGSFTRPGGSYEEGTFGPEQALCSQSNLYQVLCGMKETFHDANRDYRCGQLFTDRAALLHDVTFLRDGDVRTADVLVVAEPQRERALENHRPEAEVALALANRIETVLRIAAAGGYDALVVGAFACGRGGYDPLEVVELFRAWMDAHPGFVPRVVFAVPRIHFDVFDAAFGQPAEPEPLPQEADDADADDEDSFDPREVELPEGVTFR